MQERKTAASTVSVFLFIFSYLDPDNDNNLSGKSIIIMVPGFLIVVTVLFHLRKHTNQL